MQTAEELLQSSPWGQLLTPAQKDKALAGILVRDIPAGGNVCLKGAPVDHWIGVINGLVKISSHCVTGKTCSFTGVSSGGWVGEGSMLKNEPRRYDVIALRDSRVAYMSRSTFHWLLDNCIHFNRFLITQLNERLGQVLGLMENDRLLDTDSRIARCLAGLFNPVLYPGTDRQLHISQEELGYLAGISRQRVNQSLKALEDEGLLRVEYGGITIIDLKGLGNYGE